MHPVALRRPRLALSPAVRIRSRARDRQHQGDRHMHRRSVLKVAGAAALAQLAAPRLALAADAKVLRFVPQANLANLDPIWTTQYVVRNGSLLIWDTLFGVNDQLQPQPQMIASYGSSPDFKVWTFTLRSGLKFHDGEPVLAKDAVATTGSRSTSPTRWAISAPSASTISVRRLAT